MFYFLFYDQDVCVGEGYGTDPDDAIKRHCKRLGFGPDYADRLTPIMSMTKSEWNDNPWGCATVR